MDITDLKKHFDGATEEVKNLVVRQSEEIKSLGKSKEETAAELKKAEERLESVGTDLKDHAARLEEVEKQSKRIMSGGGNAADQLKLSAGEQFVLSEEFQRAAKSGARGTDAFKLNSLFTKKSVSRMELKELVGDGPSGDALVQPERDMTIYRDPARRINHVRQLMGTRTTTSDAIEFIQHTENFPRAGAQDGQFSEKAESNLEFGLQTSPVVTIAHWTPVSRQILNDAPMLRAYIDGELMHGLMLEEDEQILYGDGSAGTMTGILNTTGVQDVGDRDPDDNRIDHLRKAFRDARIAHYAADGVLMHPEDWAEIELLKGDDGQYLWAVVSNVVAGAEPTVWRVPVVESTAINPGDFLTGSWAMGGYLWDREQSSIRVSESHADYFIRNGVAILAEERLALTVVRPSAFVKGSFAEAG